jgi:hypothetical protein
MDCTMLFVHVPVINKNGIFIHMVLPAGVLSLSKRPVVKSLNHFEFSREGHDKMKKQVYLLNTNHHWQPDGSK